MHAGRMRGDGEGRLCRLTFAAPSVKYGAGSRHRLFATDDPYALEDRRYDKGHVTYPRARFVTWQAQVDDVSGDPFAAFGNCRNHRLRGYGELR